MMNIPDEFGELTRGFWDGSHEEVETLESWVENCGRLLDIGKVPVVRDFLRHLMAANPSDAALAGVWAEGGSSYDLLDTPDTRRIFELLLAEMEKRAAAGR